jgi:hypothetical protein
MYQFLRFTEKSLSTAIALSLFICVVTATPSHGADCEIKACIEVYIQDGRIVIEGRKGKGPSSTTATPTVPKPTPKAIPKPKPKVSKSAKPAIKKNVPAPSVTKKRIAPTIRKPRKKSAPSTTATDATSLTDKLIESIPTTGISYQPSFSPLIKTPVFFWSDVPQLITKKVEILGEVVNVRLRPIFIWHYGDGVIYMTREVGAAFPEGKIQHSYSKPGHYVIQLVTNWRGEFTIDGISAPIPGNLTTVSVLPISVVAAPIRFMN